MRKINLIESIIDFLASDLAGDQKGIYHPEIIKVHLNDVFNEMVYNTYYNGKKESDFSQLDAWSRTYICTVLNQKGTRAHAFLPFPPVQLPDGMGIRQVRSHEDYTIYGAAIGVEWLFAPIEATANAIFSELEVYTMDDYPTYSLEQSNLATGEGEESHMLKLDKLPLAPLAIISIDVLMIVPIDQLGDFEEVALPSGAEDSIVRRVIEVMGKKGKPDLLNDMEPQPTII